ncbi:MAG: hypothetical protein ACE5HS_09755 [bacterium]
MSVLDIYKSIRKISYPLTSVLIVVVSGYFLLIKNYSHLHLLMVLAAAGGLVLIWFHLRPGASEIQNAEAVFKAVGNGRPTFLNIYSNY